MSPVERKVVLALQGGGALGSYQAGVFEALEQADMVPEWIAAVSIGAINGSLIAGNPPGRRVERLRAFWQKITEPTWFWPHVAGGPLAGLERTAGAAAAVLFGQPGFFRPRPPTEWFAQPPPVSYYDTGALRSTLEALVDFDRLKPGGAVRLTVGATQIETGRMTHFDSAQQQLGPEHVMASGALPPGLAVVEVAGAPYWDGGLVSNTPLQYVIHQALPHDTLVFQVDLFPAQGPRPRNLDEVNEREKDIRYSSRTRAGTQAAEERQNFRRQLRQFLDRLPPDLLADPVAQHLRSAASQGRIDVAHLIYRPAVPQGWEKDFQFDRNTMEQRWAQGFGDARAMLAKAPWQTPAPPDVGLRTFDGPDDSAG
jgi:NTE family protein